MAPVMFAGVIFEMRLLKRRCWRSVPSFTKGVNPRLAKRPLVFNGLLANRGLTSLGKEATVGWDIIDVCGRPCGLRSCGPQKSDVLRNMNCWFDPGDLCIFNFNFHISFLSRIHWSTACSFRIILRYVKLSKSSFIVRYYEDLTYFLWAIIWFRYSNNKCSFILQFVLSASNTKVIIYGIGLHIILHALALKM